MECQKNYSKEFRILKKYNILTLCHFTHIDNLDSILKEGLLSEEEVAKRKIKHISIADEKVKARRKEKMVYLRSYYNWYDKIKKTIWQCVPLYISVKNPMLYKVLHGYKISPENIVMIQVDTLKVIKKHYCFFDGNAASDFSKEYIKLDNLENLDWSIIRAPTWNNEEEKRKKCAEFLVYPMVDVNDFYRIIVYNKKAKIKVEEILTRNHIQLKGGIIEKPNYYEWGDFYEL